METLERSLIGCRFTLYPMGDAYAAIILDALEKTNTSKVWKKTDLMSTLYLGRQRHLLDCVSAVFRHIWKEDLHFGGEFTFSKMADGDWAFSEALLRADDVLGNAATASLGEFPAYAKASIYAGSREETVALTDYMEAHALGRGLQPKRVPLATMLKGSANSLFSFFDEMLTFANRQTPFYVLHASVSANSPTKADWNAL